MQAVRQRQTVDRGGALHLHTSVIYAEAPCAADKAGSRFHAENSSVILRTLGPLAACLAAPWRRRRRRRRDKRGRTDRRRHALDAVFNVGRRAPCRHTELSGSSGREEDIALMLIKLAARRRARMLGSAWCAPLGRERAGAVPR